MLSCTGGAIVHGTAANVRASNSDKAMTNLPVRKILLGAVVVAALIVSMRWALNTFWLNSASINSRPALSAKLPLQPNSGSALISVAIRVPLAEIRSALDTQVDYVFSGQNQLLGTSGKTYICWKVRRGPLALTAQQQDLTLSATYSGTFHFSDQGAAQCEKTLGGDATSIFDQRGDISGKVLVNARPALSPNWRFDPKLTRDVTIASGSVSIAGIPIDVSGEVKPFIDRAVTKQINILDAQVRHDPAIERVAQREWAKMCRSISIAAAAPGAPDVWLELRPISVTATQPLIDANDVTLTLQVQAAIRIVPAPTNPECPFPPHFQIVSQIDHGQIRIESPVDILFTEISRVLSTQLKGRKFPDNPDATVHFTVDRASVAPSDDRLLITLYGKAQESWSWFGYSPEAHIDIWVRPDLDGTQQMLKLTDLELDIGSEAAMGFVGIAARIMFPSFKQTLDENKLIDLKPFTTSARSSIQAAIAEFQKLEDGMRANAAVTDLRLLKIEFDAKTLRVFAEAKGTVNVSVIKLPKQLEHRP